LFRWKKSGSAGRLGSTGPGGGAGRRGGGAAGSGRVFGAGAVLLVAVFGPVLFGGVLFDGVLFDGVEALDVGPPLVFGVVPVFAAGLVFVLPIGVGSTLGTPPVVGVARGGSVRSGTASPRPPSGFPMIRRHTLAGADTADDLDFAGAPSATASDAVFPAPARAALTPVP
jgi:hypothetical protein